MVYFTKTDSILICTAGHGGSVYSVDLKSGRILFEIKTGGTKDIVIHEDMMYCYRMGKTGSILEVNLNNGIVNKEYDLHEIDIHSPLQTIDGSVVLTVSRKRGKEHMQIPVIIAFEM